MMQRPASLGAAAPMAPQAWLGSVGRGPSAVMRGRVSDPGGMLADEPSWSALGAIGAGRRYRGETPFLWKQPRSSGFLPGR